MSGTSGLIQRLKISNTTLRNSQGYGFEFNNSGLILDRFENITSTNNAEGAGLIAANLVGVLDTASDFSGNTQNIVAIDIRDGISNNQVWSALNAPYELGLGSSTATLSVDAQLTISPGSTLIFNAGNWLNVSDTGALTAIGTSAQPILFTGKSHTPGFWKGVQFTFSNNINNELDHITIEDGGATGNGNANVVMFGTIGLPQRLKISNTTLRNSSGYGFEFNDGANIDKFSNVISTGNELAAGLVPGQLLGALNSASQYTGNTLDVLRVSGSNIDTDVVWPKLDVPYDILSPFNVNAALTIEAGTTMIFNANAGFRVSNTGSLTAIGTVSGPILFTASQQSPGFWTGISFIFSNNINNILDNATIEYAGNSGNGSGSIVLFGNSVSNKSNATLQNSVIRNSSTWGVWAHTESTLSSSNNTFSNNTDGDESLNN